MSPIREGESSRESGGRLQALGEAKPTEGHLLLHPHLGGSELGWTFWGRLWGGGHPLLTNQEAAGGGRARFFYYFIIFLFFFPIPSPSAPAVRARPRPLGSARSLAASPPPSLGLPPAPPSPSSRLHLGSFGLGSAQRGAPPPELPKGSALRLLPARRAPPPAASGTPSRCPPPQHFPRLPLADGGGETGLGLGGGLFWGETPPPPQSPPGAAEAGMSPAGS